MEGLSKPRLLGPEDILDTFDCGVPVLNEWLKRRALVNHLSGASRSYVVCRSRQVVGYYCLSAGAIATGRASSATSDEGRGQRRQGLRQPDGDSHHQRGGDLR